MIIKEFQEIDGIKVFNSGVNSNHEDYNAKGLDNLYASEEKHFWFLSRKDFILQNFKKFFPTNFQIIEIGAGTGNVSRCLLDAGYQNISIGEMHLNGLMYAKEYGINNRYQFDLLQPPFENEFNVVCMFDVLEHIDDDIKALYGVKTMLSERGRLALTVPSHMWLWNRDDAIAGHKIRYTKKQLVERLQKAGFEVETARYFFILITPLLLLRRILNKDDGSTVQDSEHEKDISMNPVLSKILYWISKLENKFNKFLPNWFGGSLFIIARKK